jgi:hypothetical protein
MLPTEGGDHLPGEKVDEGDKGRFGEPVLLLDLCGDRPQLRFEHHAAQDCGHPDLDLSPRRPDQEPMGAMLARLQVNDGAGDAGADQFRQAAQRRVDLRQRSGAICNRQIGQVDINREARQVPPEQVDGGAALQGEVRLTGQEGQQPDEKSDLGAVLGCAHIRPISRGTVMR